SLFRIATFKGDVLPANTAWIAHVQDIRGYDSMILQRYARFWSLLETPGALLYNQLSHLFNPASLTSPLLSLMNVKYILTRETLDVPDYTRVYQGEVNIYRNEKVLPRAFVVFRGTAASNEDEALAALARPGFDPSQEVVLEGEVNPLNSTLVQAPPVTITSYKANQVSLRVNLPQEGYLVLTDNYFPGWRARNGSGELTLLRANSTYRAVRLPAGEQSITFDYSPDSFKLGVYVSFLSGVLLLLALGYWAWPRLYTETAEASTLRRVLKNSLTPMATQVLNKVVDFAFAIFMLRLLGPLNAGKYAFAVVLIGYFVVLTDFGLTTLATREVAKSKDEANRYLSNSALLRLFLTLLSLPVFGGVLGLYAWRSELTPDIVWTGLLLMAGLFPSGLASALSSIFSAHERMEYTAAVSLAGNLLKLALGVLVLVLGFGIVGLGLVSVVVSVATAALLYVLFRRTFFRPALELDLPFQGRMLRTSYPLMINIFLSSIFFRIDVMFLKPMQGDLATGLYTTAYKFIDGLVIIPSLFTLAVFPILSRYAEAGGGALLRAYTLSLRALLILAMPLTVGISLLADRIVLLFFGQEYAPAGTALLILMWFLPFSFINSLTQYVLIAANRQRFLTLAFIIGAAFNIGTNLVLIPIYGYLGAAVTTVLSEIVLMLPFMYGIWKHVGAVPLLQISWRPVVASFVMGAVVWWLRPLNLAAPVVLGALVYAAMLFLMRTFDHEDRALVKGLLGRG
ncbi:MAG TPA: oligosaccharide flippase family protein, partial [Dehalococcoidia bacterium]|nr:oligosaccharide flippase family protein [Dehalococcoidia bacterium]